LFCLQQHADCTSHFTDVVNKGTNFHRIV